MKLTELARQVAAIEGKKKQVDIAQITEVLASAFKVLDTLKLGELAELIAHGLKVAKTKKGKR